MRPRRVREPLCGSCRCPVRESGKDGHIKSDDVSGTRAFAGFLAEELEMCVEGMYWRHTWMREPCPAGRSRDARRTAGNLIDTIVALENTPAPACIQASTPRDHG